MGVWNRICSSEDIAEAALAAIADAGIMMWRMLRQAAIDRSEQMEVEVLLLHLVGGRWGPRR